MACIYVHIPFCKKACHYCDFVFTTNLSKIASFVVALERELHLRADSIRSQQINTIYFGGGTPSTLGIKNIELVLNEIMKLFNLGENSEITLEANPEDINPSFTKGLKSIGFNRVSLGIQSLNDTILSNLNRGHTAEEALSAFECIRNTDFHSVSVDLMFGLPSQNLEGFLYDLRQVVKFEPEHLSLYSLTIEERTVFGKKVKAKSMASPDEQFQVDCFLKAEEYLKLLGYEHYEISNYAKPGYRSRHNSSYWQGIPYFGFGPGAHSYDGANTRFWNTSSSVKYIQDLGKGILPQSSEVLNNTDLLNEWIMTGIRQIEGIDLQAYSSRTGRNFIREFENIINKLVENEWVDVDEYSLKLTQTGRLYADSIAMDFFK